jgi:probable rRNA maturation factor
MIRVYIKKQSNYPVNVTGIKKELKSFLESKGLVSDFSVSVTFVSEKAMKELSKKFLGEKDSVHNVLSFPESEVRGDFEYPTGLPLSLGEIVICFPEALEEAKKEGKLTDLKVSELVKHGALHLLGEHHE